MLQCECDNSYKTTNDKFGVSATFRGRVMGKHASDERRDVITLTFDL